MTPKNTNPQLPMMLGMDVFDCDYCDLPLWQHTDVELELCYEWYEDERNDNGALSEGARMADSFFKTEIEL